MSMCRTGREAEKSLPSRQNLRTKLHFHPFHICRAGHLGFGVFGKKCKRLLPDKIDYRYKLLLGHASYNHKPPFKSLYIK